MGADLTFLSDSIHLVAIPSTGGPLIAQWFGDDRESAVMWADALNAQHYGIYWTVNRVTPGLATKPRKTDIIGVRYFHADVDDTRDAAPILALMPSVLIDSGNGLQPLWRVSGNVSQAEAEDVNQRLMAALRADACWNIDRLLRVPGTVNWPNDRKRARGREPVWSTLVQPDAGFAFSLDSMRAAFAPLPDRSELPPVDIGAWDYLRIADLKPTPDPRLLAMLHDEKPQGERSEHVARCVVSLGVAGYSNEQILGLLMHPENVALSATIYAQPNPLRQALRKLPLAARGRIDPALAFAAPAVLPPGASAAPLPPETAVPAFKWTGWDTHPNTLISSTGGIVPNVANTVIALEHAPEFADRLTYNEFLCQPMLRAGEVPHPLTDSDVTDMQIRLQRMGCARLSKETVVQAAERVARLRPFHPVRDYLRSLRWDGTPRIEHLFTFYFGVPASGYSHRIARMFMVQAVARVMQPGCKADTMLILQGDQGLGKSQAMASLAVDRAWFSDSLPDIGDGGKDVNQHLRGKWIIELGELDAMRRADDKKLKSFLSRSTEKYRPPYARFETEEPRQCVFVGTTNEDDILRDPTGSRRYWPIRVEAVNLAGILRDRDQLWAEAFREYERGTPWYAERGDGFDSLHAVEVEDRFDADPLEETLAAWLHARPERDRFTIAEIVTGAFGAVPLAPNYATYTRRASTILRRRLGWLPWKSGAIRGFFKPLGT